MSDRCVCQSNQKIYDYLTYKTLKLEQNDNNIHTKTNILRACKSIQKYPLPILNEEDALKLQGVGRTIAKLIMKSIRGGNEPNPHLTTIGNVVTTAKENASNKYRPEFGKVPWAILLVLQMMGGNANKAQLEYEISKLTATYDFIHAESFIDTNYLAIRTLTKNGLVEEVDQTQLWLTAAGLSLADKLYAAFKRRAELATSVNSSNSNNVASNTSSTTNSNSIYNNIHSSNYSANLAAATKEVSTNSSQNHQSYSLDHQKNISIANSKQLSLHQPCSNNYDYNGDDKYHNSYDDKLDLHADDLIDMRYNTKQALIRDVAVAVNNTGNRSIIDLCSPSPPPKIQQQSRRRKVQESSKEGIIRSNVEEENILLVSPTPSSTRPCRNITPEFAAVDKVNYNNNTALLHEDHNNPNSNVDYHDDYSFEVLEEYIPLKVRLMNKSNQAMKEIKEVGVTRNASSNQLIVNDVSNGYATTSKNTSDHTAYLLQPSNIINNTIPVSSITKPVAKSPVKILQSNFVDLTEEADGMSNSDQFDDRSNILTAAHNTMQTNNTYNNSNDYEAYSSSSQINNISASSQATMSLFNQLQGAPKLTNYSSKPSTLYDQTHDERNVPVEKLSKYQLLQQKEKEMKLRKVEVPTTEKQLLSESHQIQMDDPYRNTSSASAAASISTTGFNRPHVNEISHTSSQVVTIAAATAVSTTTINRSYYTEKILIPLPSIVSKWEVVLLIDKRERDNALIQSQMVANGIPSELCTLAVGDFLWIARAYGSSSAVTLQMLECNDDTDSRVSIPPEQQSNADVFVLDCIVERKTISDLASSIVDGRYPEQKARLKACGLRSTSYIIEGEHIVLPRQQKAITAQSIKTSIISINIDDAMHVIRTRSIDHTIVCLQSMHRQVKARFEKNRMNLSRLTSTEFDVALYQPFHQFQQLYGKKGAATNKQLFGHQLRQIQGVSVSVALTLMEKYGTTHNFMQALLAMGIMRAENMLSNLTRHGSIKRFGPALAKRICQVYLGSF